MKMSSHAALPIRRLYANAPHADPPCRVATSLGDRGVHDFFPRDGHLIPEVERQQQKNTHGQDDHEQDQDHTPEGEPWHWHVSSARPTNERSCVQWAPGSWC